MRGEHPSHPDRRPPPPGSSPHARGARVTRNAGVVVLGIIPACAGSTAAGPTSPPPRRDHPRMRGEHNKTINDYVRMMGSSPHARGARHGHGPADGACRIIPACAGSTCSRRCDLPVAWDHPRMRGEHIESPVPFACVSGSSPHARGAQRDRGPSYLNLGIIPACAGSTHCSMASRAP